MGRSRFFFSTELPGSALHPKAHFKLNLKLSFKKISIHQRKEIFVSTIRSFTTTAAALTDNYLSDLGCFHISYCQHIQTAVPAQKT